MRIGIQRTRKLFSFVLTNDIGNVLLKCTMEAAGISMVDFR